MIDRVDVLTDAVAAMRTGTPHSARTENRAPWAVRFPPQDGAGFHVVIQGACWLLPAAGEPVRLEVGDVVLLPRELGHTLASSRATLSGEPTLPPTDSTGEGAVTMLLCGAYMLDQGRIHPLLGELPDIVHLPARLGRHSPLRAAIDLLGHELDAEDRPGSSGVVTALLEVLLLYMLRAWHRDHTGVSGWAAALADPGISAALRAIHRNPDAVWTVQSLGEHAGMSRSAFAQRFTGTVGTTPQAYLTWWRMTLAARMLRDTDEPLRVIAHRCGYRSEYAFAKAFKREFGTAPGRYRTRAARLRHG